MLPPTTALATQQLAEFLALVSSVPDRLSATQMTTERAAKALEAEVAAVLGSDGAVVDLVGFPLGSVPAAELIEVAAGARSVLEVPGAGRCHTAVAQLDGRVRGHLLVARSGDDTFSGEEVGLLRGMARVLELTVDTLHMFEVERNHVAEMERLFASLQDRHRLLEQLSEVQRAITRRAPLQQVLDAITDGAQALLGDEVAALRLFDPEDGRILLLASCTGIAGELTRRLWRLPLTEAGVSGQAVRRNELVVMPRYPDSSEWLPELAADRLQAGMAAPVHDKNTVVGALSVASYRPDRVYTARDQQILQVFAEQVSLAVTDAKTREAMQQAFHDSLTGLASRALFMDRLDQALVTAGRRRTHLAALFVDLDGFKLINDSLGHTAGDAVLVGVAGRLRSCLRPADTAARLGGDEFAVVLQEVDRDGAVAVAERIIEALRAPFQIDGKEVFVNASIGVAFNTDRDTDARMLLRNADLAMYHAKRNGKGRHEIFEPTMRTMPVRSLDLESDLHRALAAGEFVLHYQPIVELADGAPDGLAGGRLGGRVAAVEALARWLDPEHGLTSPQKFIPLAEETGLILPIGRWVIHEACRQTSAWNAGRPGQPPLAVSVNLSARQLQQADLPDIVAATLSETGLPSSCLMLEITESQLLRDTEITMDVLRRLEELGVRLAIDDFGTGYSSLTYLRHFPIDIVKIDKSFVDEISSSSKGAALVRGIVQFANTLDITTIAEGIEAPDQLRLLRESGCPLGQGYLFAKPLEADDIAVLLGTGG
jgi:diguanylate cyclase (GGDEF)-like protein